MERVHMTEGVWSGLMKDLSRELHLKSIALGGLHCGNRSYVEMLAIKCEPEDGSSPTYSSYAAHNDGATMSEFLFNLKSKPQYGEYDYSMQYISYGQVREQVIATAIASKQAGEMSWLGRPEMQCLLAEMRWS